jgi:hypothetical protein
MPAGRCRMHGGASTGPRRAEGLERVRKARTTHGMRSGEMEQMRTMVRLLKAEAKRLVELAAYSASFRRLPALPPSQCNVVLCVDIGHVDTGPDASRNADHWNRTMCMDIG